MYGMQAAINDISFSIKKGEILGFLGPNGAGKSTTMKIMTCFIPPTSGSVQIGDHNIKEHSLEVRSKIGYLPEHNPLYLDMYVKEFLQFAGKIQGVSKQKLPARIAEVIDMTGLGIEQHKKIGMLSKGYRQRVGLAQALIHDPEVFILDEPTTGLDPNQIIEIRNLIKEIGKDKTVIFSSHILPEVQAIADRVVIINKGRIIADRPTNEITQLVKTTDTLKLSVDKLGFDHKALTKIAAVDRVELLSETSYRIHLKPNSEIGNALFEECQKQGMTITELNKEQLSLEDAFRELTR